MKAKREEPSTFNATVGTRPVHLRRMRAARRRVFTKQERIATDQVRTLCGKWVPRCEAVRDDNADAMPSCAACVGA